MSAWHFGCREHARVDAAHIVAERYLTDLTGSTTEAITYTPHMGNPVRGSPYFSGMPMGIPCVFDEFQACSHARFYR